MKPLFSLLLLGGLALAACNNDKKVTQTHTSEDGTTTTTTVDVSDMESSTDEMTQKMEELKKLKPLTLDELKALLPEEIAGTKRSNFNANSTMGFAMAEASYQKENEDRELKLTVFDCAGEAGSGIYGMSYWTKMNMQQESDDGYIKTVSFNGDKAVETFKKGSNEATITYVVADRLLVTLSGYNMDVAEVKAIGESLKMKL